MSTTVPTLGTIPSAVIMQPTTLCNLDCGYCYLPLRSSDRRMSVELATRVAHTVNRWAAGLPMSVVWHGGEPLACGPEHLDALMAPFIGVAHHLQTNATLINDEWCDLFQGRDVRVSVSLDGATSPNRTNRAGRGVDDQIQRGVELLRDRGIPFAAIAVVTDPAPGAATQLYEHFADLGCTILGVNIEEQEGVNARQVRPNRATTTAFWAELLTAWRANPVIAVREIERVLQYAKLALTGRGADMLPRTIDPFPSVAYDGTVIMISPELVGFTDPHYGGFASGNIWQADLDQIIAEARETGWVPEFLTGVARCRQTCAYFEFCGGGMPSNRYFEHGRFDGTETDFCINTKMCLFEGVVGYAQNL